VSVKIIGWIQESLATLVLIRFDAINNGKKYKHTTQYN
jgi:hypothetical protein